MVAAMNRRSITDLERDLEDLEAKTDDEDGFLHIQIGGDPDKGGYYTWNSERSAYVNEAGYELPPDAAADSEFEWNIEYGHDKDET